VPPSGESPGLLEARSPLSVCSIDGDCPGGTAIICVYPPKKVPNAYFSIAQAGFTARPSTMYNISFLVRCLNYDSTYFYMDDIKATIDPAQ